MAGQTQLLRAAAGAVAGSPRRGDRIAGKYVIEDVLGKGGAGVVLSARDTVLRRRVAVKVLLPEALEQPGACERFLREARSAASIRSEHVARVIDVGTLETGAPYMVMEHLEGRDLRRMSEARGPLPVEEAIDYVLQACEAIAEAHGLGIVHRDLKPSNLFLTERADGSPLVKVLDFGLSKVSGREDPSLTTTDMVAGSPHAMSPEQVRSLKNVDARTDVWAVGGILYQLLTASPPFDGPTVTAVLASVLTEPPEPPSKRRPDLPLPVEEVVLRCLEKDVSVRVQSIAELARLLAPWGSEASRLSAARIERLLSREHDAGDSMLEEEDAALDRERALSASPPAEVEGAEETNAEPHAVTLSFHRPASPRRQAHSPPAAETHSAVEGSAASATGESPRTSPGRRRAAFLGAIALAAILGWALSARWASRVERTAPGSQGEGDTLAAPESTTSTEVVAPSVASAEAGAATPKPASHEPPSKGPVSVPSASIPLPSGPSPARTGAGQPPRSPARSRAAGAPAGDPMDRWQ